MWQIKTWPFKTPKGRNSARAAMQKWIDKNGARIQWEQIFVNNAYGITYRKLKRIY